MRRDKTKPLDQTSWYEVYYNERGWMLADRMGKDARDTAVQRLGSARALVQLDKDWQIAAIQPLTTSGRPDPNQALPEWLRKQLGQLELPGVGELPPKPAKKS